MQNTEVRVSVGAQVHELLAREDFVARWQRLYERCPWATAGQRPEFARSWYRVYREQAFPVLVHAELADGDQGDGEPRSELVGLLGLYLREGWLEHVGRGNCEYNVWIALPEHGETFMPRAIGALDRRLSELKLGSASIVFGFMPPDTPVSWLSRTTGTAARCQLEHTSRRVLRVSDPEQVSAYIRGKSRLRTSMNKLKRTGDVRFRRVTEPAEMKRVLAEFEWMIEFRKGAVFGSLPFRDEPLRREFLRAQTEVPGLLHVTTLERGGRILAAHVATCGRRELSIAGIVHCEFEARHSPGSLLMLELIPLLSREGIELLDFTPGDDEYKTRFATETEPVYSLTVYGTRLAREAERARELLETAARRLPQPIREQLKALRDRRLWSPLARAAPAASHVEFQEITPEPRSGIREVTAASVASAHPEAALSGPLEVGAWAPNAVEHLVRYRGAREAYVELLRRAHRYVRAGARMYTRTSGNRLEAACFVLPSDAFAPSVGLPGGAVLCDLERWGDAGTKEQWLRELGHLLRSEQPLFVARPAPRDRTGSGTAARIVRATTPLDLVVAAAPRRPEDTAAATAARSA